MLEDFLSEKLFCDGVLSPRKAEFLYFAKVAFSFKMPQPRLSEKIHHKKLGPSRITKMCVNKLSLKKYTVGHTVTLNFQADMLTC